MLIHGVLHLLGHDHVHGGTQARRMKAEEARHHTVAWASLFMTLRPGRAGFAFYPEDERSVGEANVPAGEAIPGTPIPTAGPVSLNTPDAAAVIAAAADAKAAVAATEPVAPVTRRPGRPARAKETPVTQPAAGTLAVTEPLPEGARQTTVDEAQAAGEAAPVASEALAGMGKMLEIAALQGVQAYVANRLKALGQ